MNVFDIETDGLNPTLIHCLSFSSKYEPKGIPTINTTHDYEEMRKFLLNAKVLVGHNIQRYDIPALGKLLGIEIKAKLVDTLAISWYVYHGRTLHGLEAWGEDLGVPKPPITDWVGLTPEEYANRCESDVKINYKLLRKAWKDLLKLYGDEEGVWRLIDYLEFKMDCAREQERSRWRLDVPRCEAGIEDLSVILEQKTEELSKVMPQVKTYTKRVRPKSLFKMNGDKSAAGERWFSLLEREGLPESHTDPIKEHTGWKDPNPGSTPQIKDWLFSLGWEPETMKSEFSEKLGGFKEIPQIRVKVDDEVILCPSVQKLFIKEPKLEVLQGMTVVAHRISVLKGFMADVDDNGYIAAQIQGLTNTMRFKHKVVLNLPGVDKPYGELIRGCLIAPEGYELCGSDQCGLEDRTKQHYMMDHDPEYVKDMLEPGFDPHLDIGITAGMLTKEDADRYKAKDPEAKAKFSGIRHDAKQVNYSCTYGITPGGLARNNGWSKNKSEGMHAIYWRRNWSIQAIADSCEVKRCLGGMWLYNPVSHLWYSLRNMKDRFSTLNQGTGTYCFDMWVKKVRSKRSQCTGQVHDEIILTIKKGNRDKCIKLLKESIQEVNIELGMKRDLDVDIQFGDTYADIH